MNSDESYRERAKGRAAVFQAHCVAGLEARRKRKWCILPPKMQVCAPNTYRSDLIITVTNPSSVLWSLRDELILITGHNNEHTSVFLHIIWRVFGWSLHVLSPHSDFDMHELMIYEEVARVPPFKRKTLVLIGAQGVGRRSLKNKLLVSDPRLFGTTIPCE